MLLRAVKIRALNFYLPHEKNQSLGTEAIIIVDYDGIYLFANLNALPFYQKTGFKEGLQYQYALKKRLDKSIEKRKSF